MAHILKYDSQELAKRSVRAGVQCDCGKFYTELDLEIDRSNTGDHDYYIKTTDLDKPSWIYMNCKRCKINTKLTHALSVALEIKV